MRTKESFAEEVLRSLSADVLTRDFKISPREVYPRLDAVVNDLASKSFFRNWQAGYRGLSEMFWTTWENIEVIDNDDEQPSTLTLPATYIDIGRNEGIELIPLANPDIIVIITTIKEMRQFRNTPAGDLQGGLAAYPIGNKMVFNRTNVQSKYGNMMTRLAVRDSAAIPANQPYPIPADQENTVTSAVVAWFRERMRQGIDPIRDDNLQMQ